MMKINFKSLLKDKNVLYVVLFLAVSNLFGYLLMREIDAVVFFLVVGFLATYFSKNMIVVMLIAMISTNLLIGSKHLRSVKEGMGGNNRKKTVNVVAGGEEVVEIDVDVKNGKEEVKESMVKLSPASVNSKKPTLDYAGTVETAYDNLDDLLSSDAIKNMTADTQRLAEKQKQLINNIGKLEPVMKKAGKLLDGIDMGGINSIVSTLSGTLGKLTGDGKQE
jgi:hypothetical protein